MPNNSTQGNEELCIRISRNDLSFATYGQPTKSHPSYVQYPIRNGIAMAANLRNAFKDTEMLTQEYLQVTALIDSPVVMVPVQEFNEEESNTLYHYTITGMEGNQVIHQPLENLNTVAVFCINKDLRLVLDEHFNDIRYLPLPLPVWNYLYNHSFNGIRKKLYVFFHDKRMEVFSFDKTRFKFCNSFDTEHAQDAVYYILYVWQQLGYNAQHDEIYLTGTIPETRWMTEALQHYVQKTNILETPDDIHLAPFTHLGEMPFDLQVLFAQNK